MSKRYSLRDSSVLFEGREELHRKEVDDAVLLALRRKLLRSRFDRGFFEELSTKGEAAITWNLTRYNRRHDEEWVTFHAWRLSDGTHSLHCVGPKSEDVIDRINSALFNKTPKWLKKKLRNEERKSNGRRKQKKRVKLKRKQERAPTPAQVRRSKVRHPKGLRFEELTPQFRKNFIFWNDALDCIVHTFGIVRDGKSTARQIAARSLYRSLEKYKVLDEHGREKFSCAQYVQGGFCLRFELIEERWRGMDLTVGTVHCTKDNKHPYYRRMRACLREKLLGLPPQARAARRDLALLGKRIAA